MDHNDEGPGATATEALCKTTSHSVLKRNSHTDPAHLASLAWSRGGSIERLELVRLEALA